MVSKNLHRCSIQKHGDWRSFNVINDTLVWTVNVIRNLNDWEVHEYESLLQLLADQHAKTSSDQILQKLKQNYEFSVKSYYSHIMLAGQSRRKEFPALQIWKTKVSPRMAFFVCEACRECTLTTNKLMKRGHTELRNLATTFLYGVLQLIAFGAWFTGSRVPIGPWWDWLGRRFGFGVVRVKRGIL